MFSSGHRWRRHLPEMRSGRLSYNERHVVSKCSLALHAGGCSGDRRRRHQEPLPAAHHAARLSSASGAAGGRPKARRRCAGAAKRAKMVQVSVSMDAKAAASSVPSTLAPWARPDEVARPPDPSPHGECRRNAAGRREGSITPHPGELIQCARGHQCRNVAGGSRTSPSCGGTPDSAAATAFTAHAMMAMAKRSSRQPRSPCCTSQDNAHFTTNPRLIHE